MIEIDRRFYSLSGDSREKCHLWQRLSWRCNATMLFSFEARSATRSSSHKRKFVNIFFFFWIFFYSRAMYRFVHFLLVLSFLNYFLEVSFKLVIESHSDYSYSHSRKLLYSRTVIVLWFFCFFMKLYFVYWNGPKFCSTLPLYHTAVVQRCQSPCSWSAKDKLLSDQVTQVYNVLRLDLSHPKLQPTIRGEAMLQE